MINTRIDADALSKKKKKKTLQNFLSDIKYSMQYKQEFYNERTSQNKKERVFKLNIYY